MTNEYIKEVRLTNKKVYVFGAGKVARIIYRLLLSHSIEIVAFLVTDKDENISELFGREVIQADDPSVDKSCTVLIAVLEYGDSRIKGYLQSLGYKKTIDVPENVLEYDSWEYKRMRTPIIEVTPKIGCIVSCKYCPQNLLINNYFKDDKDRKSIMSLDDYKSYLEKCPKETIVDFSGFVEPFLVENTIEMMEYTYLANHEMTLFTTLRGLTLENAKRVVEMPFKFVCLHVPDKDGYASLPMNDEYFEVLDLFLSSAVGNKETFVDVANCQSTPHPEIIKRTRGKLKIYCEMSDRAGNLDVTDLSLTHVKKEGEIYCSKALALNHNVLLPDGSLVLCCNDFGLENVLGNLNEQSYEEIMKGVVLRDIKYAMHIDVEKEIICRKCMFAKSIK